jgi:hypothetical protein
MVDFRRFVPPLIAQAHQARPDSSRDGNYFISCERVSLRPAKLIR